MRSVGLDLGAREVAFCEVHAGEVVARRTVSLIAALKDVLGCPGEPARIAIEACREAWHVHDVLRSWGHEVLMVDTTRAKRLGIGQHGRKTDRVDAETLARAVEQGNIPLAHVLSPSRRALRDELLVRQALVETRAQYVTSIRGLVRAHGAQVGSCSSKDFVEKVRAAKLEPELQALIEPLLSILGQLDGHIARVDAKLERYVTEEPVIQRLTSTPGVGLIVAAAFVAVVDDAKRFHKAHQVESYLGLVPSESTTGGRDRRRLGSITKHGNPYLRSMLVQAAWAIWRLKAEDPLRRWVHDVAKRRGNRIAVVALARRLAGVLWAIWRDGSVYDPDQVGRASARGLSAKAQTDTVRAVGMKQAGLKAARRARKIEQALANTKKAKEVTTPR